VKLRLLVSAAFIVLAVLVVVDAFAEDAPATPPAPPKYYLEVDAADLDVLEKAIADLPFKIANPLLLKINGQLRAQDQLKASADKVISDATEKAKNRK